MKLYTTPGGQWSGTEKDWKAHMKAEGLDPKTYTGRPQVDVPTSKPGLLEFLSFHHINVINPGTSLPREDAADGGAIPQPPAPPSAVPATTQPGLDAAFMAAPISKQLSLAAYAVEAAETRLRGQ